MPFNEAAAPNYTAAALSALIDEELPVACSMLPILRCEMEREMRAKRIDDEGTRAHLNTLLYSLHTGDKGELVVWLPEVPQERGGAEERSPVDPPIMSRRHSRVRRRSGVDAINTATASDSSGHSTPTMSPIELRKLSVSHESRKPSSDRLLGEARKYSEEPRKLSSEPRKTSHETQEQRKASVDSRKVSLAEPRKPSESYVKSPRVLEKEGTSRIPSTFDFSFLRNSRKSVSMDVAPKQPSPKSIKVEEVKATTSPRGSPKLSPRSKKSGDGFVSFGDFILTDNDYVDDYTTRTGADPNSPTNTAEEAQLRDVFGSVMTSAPQGYIARNRAKSIMMGQIREVDEIEEVVDDSPDTIGGGSEASSIFAFGDFAVGAGDDYSSSDDDDVPTDSGEVFLWGDCVVPARKKSMVGKKVKPVGETLSQQSYSSGDAQKRSSVSSLSFGPTNRRRLLEPCTPADAMRHVSHRMVAGHPSKVSSVSVTSQAASDESIFISTCTTDTTLAMWRNTGRWRFTHETHGFSDASIICVTTTNDGKLLASGAKDGELSLFDLHTGKRLLAFNHPMAVTAVSFSANKQFVASGCRDNGCRIWSTKRKQQAAMLAFFGHSGPVSAIRFKNIGDHLISASADKTIQQWSAAKASKPLHVVKAHSTPVHSAHYSHEGAAYIVGLDSTIISFSASATGTLLYVLPVSELVAARPMRRGHPPTTYCTMVMAPPALPDHLVVATSDGAVHVVYVEGATVGSVKRCITLYTTKCKSPVWQMAAGTHDTVVLGEECGNVSAMKLMAGHPSCVDGKGPPPPLALKEANQQRRGRCFNKPFVPRSQACK